MRIISVIWNISNPPKKKPLIRTVKTKQKEKKESPQNEDSIRSLWDNFKLMLLTLTSWGSGRRRETARN